MEEGGGVYDGEGAEEVDNTWWQVGWNAVDKVNGTD